MLLQFSSLQLASTSAGTWFGATLPTLPQTTPDPTFTLPAAASTNNGAYYTPANLATLQTNINTAAAASGTGGDVIKLTHGTTYGPGTLTLPAHGTTHGTIYIVSDAIPELGGGLPAAGTRVNNTTDLANMPIIQGTTNANTVIQDAIANSSSSNYHFVGCAIEGVYNTLGGVDGQLGLIYMGGSITSQGSQPNNVFFERCYISGDPTYGSKRGVYLAGNAMGVSECYIENIWDAFNVNNNADNQAFASYNSGAGYLIRNNFMAAAGETFLFGGADPNIVGSAVASDITISRNTLFKDPANFGVAGKGYGKNCGELKSAQRVLIDKNHFEACYGGQSAAIAFTVRNQSGGETQSTVSDVTFTNNRLANSLQPGQGFINFLGQDSPGGSGGYSQPCRRILIRNNLLINTSPNSGGGCQLIQLTLPSDGNQNPTDLTVDHNTLVSTVPTTVTQTSWLFVAAPLIATNPFYKNVVFSNNVIDILSNYGVSDNSAGGDGMTNVLANYLSTSCCVSNAVLKPFAIANSGFPATYLNTDVANESAFSFTNVGASDYSLTVGSTFHAAGRNGNGYAYNTTGTADSTDLGANMANVAA